LSDLVSDNELFRRLETSGRRLLGAFTSLTDAQRVAIPWLLDRHAVLLVARTASGKTEAVLAPLLTLAAREGWRSEPSILYVAPTRALVNDLHRRLSEKLDGYVSVGRRTGEYRDPDNALLVTTPESLDSMLARGRRELDHLLAGVRAVVLDELHLIAESPRGTQLQVLLGRLDEVARAPVLRAALSATVPSPGALARRFLGPDARVCSAAGSRPLRVVRRGGDGPLPDRLEGVDPLAAEILRGSDGDTDSDDDPVAEALLAERRATAKLKALVFVPTRARCDRLTGRLARAFTGRCPVVVHAHHGSLDQRHREETEGILTRADESVAVATMTLEVGIDVGDVGVVVLDGPPGSVSSLLQRVGRGNRRSSEVRVIPFALDDVAAVTMASMLRAAVDGDLDPAPETAHYSVAIQQFASIFFQSRRARRKRDELELLLASAFGAKAQRILEELFGAGWIALTDDGRIGPSEALRELMDSPMRLHGNIGGSGAVIPLVDAVTGDPVAWIPRGNTEARIVVAGASYQADNRGDRVELRYRKKGGAGAQIRYANRGTPLGRTALRHLCVGLGLPDPVVVSGAEHVHFGGALFARLLTLAGIESGPLRASSDPREALKGDLLAVTDRQWERLEGLCGFGPFHSELPESLRREAVIETVRAHDPVGWLSSMQAQEHVSAEQQRILDGA
jgi:ATP-dependent helicase Lhr and Lhr-like helicase